MKARIILTILFIAMLMGCQQEIEPETGNTTEPPAEEPECTTNEDCIPAQPMAGAQYLCEDGKCVQKGLGNPASMKCEEDNGTLEIREGEDGQYGVCILPDGTECEEWAYFEGKCPAPIVEGICSGEPVHLRAECCQKELKCDFAEIAVYTAATGQCSCEPTNIKRQCAAVQCGVGKFSVFDPNIGECICVQSGTGVAEAGPVKEMKEITTWQEAKQAVMEAFDAKWRKIPDGCGRYESGKLVPEKITVEEAEQGWTAEITYYCGKPENRPDEPDHAKTVKVTRQGEVSGL